MKRFYIKILTTLLKFLSTHVDKNRDQKIAQYMNLQAELKFELFQSYKKKYYVHEIPYLKFEDIPIRTYQEAKEEFTQGMSADKTLFHETTTYPVKKKIPYTLKLLISFSKSFIIWMGDMMNNYTFKNYHFLIDQKFYTSHNWVKRFFGLFLDPLSIKLNKDTDFKQIAKQLVDDEKIEALFISSPRYLLSILDHIENKEMEKKFLERIQLVSIRSNSKDHKDYIRLKGLYPQLHIKKRGVSTIEGPITVALTHLNAGLPCFEDVYFEFIHEKTEHINTLSQLEPLERYELVMSQRAGILRLKTGMIFMVREHYHSIPLLDLVDQVSSYQSLKDKNEKASRL